MFDIVLLAFKNATVSAFIGINFNDRLALCSSNLPTARLVNNDKAPCQGVTIAVFLET